MARLRSHAGAVLSNPPVAEARQLAGLDPKRIFAAVAAFYGLDEAALSRRHDPHLGRAVAAWLCRRYTEASLRELAKWLGLSRADSVPNLTRRLEARLKASPELSDDLIEIRNSDTHKLWNSDTHKLWSHGEDGCLKASESPLLGLTHLLGNVRSTWVRRAEG